MIPSTAIRDNVWWTQILQTLFTGRKWS